jgi:hypothetical protein
MTPAAVARRVHEFLGSGMRAFACGGVEKLSGSKKSEQRMAGSDRVPAKGKARDGKRGKTATNAVSRALRSVYDDTLREDVPADFIDLLGKLA